ncbi:hypothetical protein C5167_002698 [Papaver somniferum]|uniref:Protein kinase domain-containing protein n=1 Tax=Papaver somniferum TaxID=3469 RepID=A0A4Y7L2T7_PAPSO|nr:hypothetical protein C5167_002698 [Papaver somniferum]
MYQLVSSCSPSSSCINQCHCVGDTGPLPFVRRFSLEDIKRATGGFRRIISNYSQGSVYKAQFRDGLLALVKEVTALHEGKDAFLQEVKLLRRLHHRHLVSLRGFATGPERFLVFEYPEHGSLKEHLNDPLKTPLSWRTRLQIAIGVTAALVGVSVTILRLITSDTFENWVSLLDHAIKGKPPEISKIKISFEYLNFFCEPPINHVSISSSNVLLDENFVAKLSGIAFLGSPGNHIGMSHSHASCSEGHMDQDCKDMIFQLGVLILELITGQSSEKEGGNLVRWVQESKFIGSVDKIVDPDLGNSYDSKELKSLLAVARFCTKTGDKPTVSIQLILRYLQGK